jgi:hypothetical protein
MTAQSEPATWFQVITAKGHRLWTFAVLLLVIAVVALSMIFPTASSWLIVAGGLIAILWYVRMMAVYRAGRRRSR